MYGILFLRCHARLKSRLRPAVMWQMHVINKTSFVLCSFQIIEPAVPELKCAWFYCLLRSYKSALQLCGLSEHVDVAFITNQKWVWLLSYGPPFVSKLWHDIRAVFSHVYLQPFLLHDIRAFFLPRILAFFPALWGFYSQVYDHFLTNVHIYAHKKSPYICVTKQACVCGVTESRRIRDSELYRQQKTPSCTMELKSNFSLHQAWPQWLRYI